MSKEAMKLALEALKQIDEAMPFPVAKLAQAALREALASEAIEQLEQQLVATDAEWDGVLHKGIFIEAAHGIKEST